MAKVTMPQLGESVAEGTIGKWLKQPGDHVDKYEALLEVITDKVNAEVPSPFEGTLKEILVQEGETVPNNAEIAVIETADGAATTAPADPAAGASEGSPTEAAAPVPAAREESGAARPSADAAAAAPGPVAVGPAGSDERPERGSPPPPSSRPMPETVAATAGSAAAGAATDRHDRQPTAAAAAEAPGSPDARMTPAVRRLLREHGLQPEQIVGTGGGGRITREDVTNYVESQRTGRPVNGQSAAPAQPAAQTPAGAPAAVPAAAATRPARGVEGQAISFPPGVDDVLVPMTQMRKGIAAQMTRSLSVPHAYVHMEVDAARLVRAREAAKRDYQAREGISLSYVPFVTKAVVAALTRHPGFNAHWTDDGLLAKRRVNMGVAVAVDDGLIVPVVRDVDQLSIAGINRAIADLAGRARANKFKVDDFGGSTFTIDNTGWFGSNLTMPIINVPEVAILTMEAITKRPVVVESADGDVIAIRPIMNMVLAIDHRANDGAQAAAFLRDVKTWLEAVDSDTPIY